jgi:hypothetical protein
LLNREFVLSAARSDLRNDVVLPGETGTETGTVGEDLKIQDPTTYAPAMRNVYWKPREERRAGRPNTPSSLSSAEG